MSGVLGPRHLIPWDGASTATGAHQFGSIGCPASSWDPQTCDSRCALPHAAFYSGSGN